MRALTANGEAAECSQLFSPSNILHMQRSIQKKPCRVCVVSGSARGELFLRSNRQLVSVPHEASFQEWENYST